MDSDDEPERQDSPTARAIESLKLHGYRASCDEPDPRPMPDDDRIASAVGGALESLMTAFLDTPLEPDADKALWDFVNIFHKYILQTERQLDDNASRQKRSWKEQDGSEVRSVELEKLIAQGESLLEKRDAYERLRDVAGEHYKAQTGSSWRPRAGSLVNHRQMTAAVIDSRDFIAARRRADTELMLPKGPKIVLSGGSDCQDHRHIWAVLDKALAKHPDMALVHGGSPKGAEFIAARWADARKVAQIVFKPDWSKDDKAAPFRRNDRMLEIVPAGVIVFPGAGVTNNLADKAKKLGVPVLDLRDRTQPQREGPQPPGARSKTRGR